MNNQRRKEIKNVVKELENIKNTINSILIDEQFCYDNMPENLQGSTRAINSEDAIDNLNDACDLIDDVIGSLDMVN